MDAPPFPGKKKKFQFLFCRVNDCILRVNNVDCRDIDRSTLIHTLKTATSTVNLLVKRRRVGKRYNTTLNLNGSYHGLSLELGAYVAKIQPGSVAAKEGSIAVGDRIVGVSHILAWLYYLEKNNKAMLSVLSPHLPSINLGDTYIPCFYHIKTFAFMQSTTLWSYITHWDKNPQFIQKITFWES